jgi:membrane associated rhomboid family serine protease
MAKVMARNPNSEYSSTLEAIIYPFLLLSLLWSIYLIEQFYPKEFIQLGILPKTIEGLKGIFFSPLIHSPSDIKHILNNSFPAVVLFAALVYFYHKIAAKIFFLAWIFSGLFVWIFAENTGSYHIGFSGVIYALAGFLFTSGTIRKVRNLQGISLFVVFIYGGMIWGIFPLEERVSWEGHLFGLFVGIILAFMFKKQGPQAKKYQYEIEKELGIEPPDLEAVWLENKRLAEERNEELKMQHNNENTDQELKTIFGEKPKIVYEYKKKKDSE